ncbi:MAG TPA: 2OG-Fe(II) oxygenase [Casimicrobiaceae bacterium]|nr:2OG-Fe(II) oxygenase [Casimicrobiaceae bacterium]
MTASLRTGAAPPITPATVADAALARICAAIADDRVAIEPGFLAAHAVHALVAEARRRDGFEGHYSLYPPGTSYRRHRDSFRDDDARVLSCVLYLNDAWTAADGGTLRLYLAAGETRDVLPVAGTLLCFFAPRYEREVLPASRERLAVSGWFLRRN